MKKKEDLRLDFYHETGDTWINTQSEPDIDYVEWLENKVLSTLKSAKEEVKSAEEILNNWRKQDSSKIPHWIPMKLALKAMHEYASQFQSVQPWGESLNTDKRVITTTNNPDQSVQSNEDEDGMIKSAWDLKSVLGKLVEAADILLHQKDYDGHGWEEIEICYKRGKQIIESVKGEGERRMEIEDLMEVVWVGGQESMLENGKNFFWSLKTEGSSTDPKSMTVKDVIDTIMQMIGDKHSESKDMWISVKDKLPEMYSQGMSRDVLTLAGSKMKVKSYDWELQRWNGSPHITITHWMPLPEPPKK